MRPSPRPQSDNATEAPSPSDRALLVGLTSPPPLSQPKTSSSKRQADAAARREAAKAASPVHDLSSEGGFRVQEVGSKLTRSAVAARFAALDRSGDGVLDRSELAAAIQVLIIIGAIRYGDFL